MRAIIFPNLQFVQFLGKIIRPMIMV